MPDHRGILALAVAVLVAGVLASPAAGQGSAPPCAPGGDPVVEEATFGADAAKTYRLVPFDVADATTRVEVAYDWGDEGVAPGTPLTETTVDLGLRDADGPMSWDGFRGWSGSRHKEVFVQADDAARGYLAAPVEPGVWHAELGIAAVSPEGGWYRVEIRCLDPDVGDPPPGTAANPDPVDPDHVADPEPGWYHGDFHMHGYHSHPDGPSWDEFVAFAREQGLDFTPITEYVTSAHWFELGAVQRANPDLLLWPSREIITYHGHAIGLGETWGHVEYRHGFDGVSMGDIQRSVKRRGALFQVAHPTTFEGPLFENFCRGCAWELEEDIDWDLVDTIEVQTGPAVVRPNSDPRSPGFENPFMAAAIDYWEDLLNRGHRITAVGGSDDKLAGEGGSPYGAYSPHGVPAVAVRADELSRDGLVEAISAGRAYLRTRGVDDSPSLELTATAPDGRSGSFGATFAASAVEVEVEIAGGQGQLLTVIRNGEEVDVVPVTGDPFTHTFTAERAEGDEGPLGTWWRVETRDAQSRTTIANPVFLAPAQGAPPAGDDGADGGRRAPERGGDGDRAALPATGGGPGGPVAAAVLAAVLVGAFARGRGAAGRARGRRAG